MTRDQCVEWFLKWRKPIRSWLRNRRSVSPNEIDDLTQEVFLRLLRYSDKIDVGNPQGYLFRIAANVANEWHERHHVCKPHDSEWLKDLLIEDEHQPDFIVMNDESNEVFYRVLHELPPRQCLTMLLKIEGLNYKEIADERKVTARVAMRDIHRSYNALRVRLNPAHMI